MSYQPTYSTAGMDAPSSKGYLKLAQQPPLQKAASVQNNRHCKGIKSSLN